MKWFKTEFLPSLEERYNQRNGKMWLTVKQTNVCKDYNSITVFNPTTKHQFTQNQPKKCYISTPLAAFFGCVFPSLLWRICVRFDTESTHLTTFVC